MSLSETMTALMDSARSLTHTTQKMNIEDLTKLISNYLGFKRNYIYNAVLLNDITEPGIYYSTGIYLSGKPANIKKEDTITLLVFQDQFANKIQIFVGSNNIFWVRRWENNSYTAWQEVGGVVNLILTATFERRCVA